MMLCHEGPCNKQTGITTFYGKSSPLLGVQGSSPWERFQSVQRIFLPGSISEDAWPELLPPS
jgi:hypothetical protein